TAFTTVGGWSDVSRATKRRSAGTPIASKVRRRLWPTACNVTDGARRTACPWIIVMLPAEAVGWNGSLRDRALAREPLARAECAAPAGSADKFAVRQGARQREQALDGPVGEGDIAGQRLAVAKDAVVVAAAEREEIVLLGESA